MPGSKYQVISIKHYSIEEGESEILNCPLNLSA